MNAVVDVDKQTQAAASNKRCLFFGFPLWLSVDALMGTSKDPSQQNQACTVLPKKNKREGDNSNKKSFPRERAINKFSTTRISTQDTTEMHVDLTIWNPARHHRQTDGQTDSHT